MKIRLAAVLMMAIVAALFTVACDDDDEPEILLIGNSSFESNGAPDLTGWLVDSVLGATVRDAAPRAGDWSLALEPGWIPEEGEAVALITGRSGDYALEVSFWGKTTQKWQGFVQVGAWPLTIVDTAQKMAFSSPDRWTEYNFTAYAFLRDGDTLALKLSAGWTEVASGEVRFDRVQMIARRLKI
jgi:hypothetical protein